MWVSAWGVGWAGVWGSAMCHELGGGILCISCLSQMGGHHIMQCGRVRQCSSVLVVVLWQAGLSCGVSGHVWVPGFVAGWGWWHGFVAVVVAWGLCSGFVSQMAGVVLFCIGGEVVVGGLQPSGEQLCMGAGDTMARINNRTLEKVLRD
jgi:hypothetical protein